MSWPCDMIDAKALATVQRTEVFRALYEAADERYKAFVDESGIALVSPYPRDFDDLITFFPLVEFCKFIDRVLDQTPAYICRNQLNVNNYVDSTLFNACEIEGWFLDAKHELIKQGLISVSRLSEWVMQRYIWITSKKIPKEFDLEPVPPATYDPPTGFYWYTQVKISPKNHVHQKKWPVGPASIKFEDYSVPGLVAYAGTVNIASEMMIFGRILFDMGLDLSDIENPILDGWKYPRQRPITP